MAQTQFEVAMGGVLQDLKYGLRMLARNSGATFVMILTLGLAIGANTAIFSVVYGVLLRPLPYPKPDQIAMNRWLLVVGSAALSSQLEASVLASRCQQMCEATGRSLRPQGA